jgi:hypothetical protein
MGSCIDTLALSFGKRRSRRKSRKVSKKSSKSRRGSIRKECVGSVKNRTRLRRLRRRSHRFGAAGDGMGGMGPGYAGATSYTPATYANYFGGAEPFVNPPAFYLPVVGGKTQSPDMLYPYKN